MSRVWTRTSLTSRRTAFPHGMVTLAPLNRPTPGIPLSFLPHVAGALQRWNPALGGSLRGGHAGEKRGNTPYPCALPRALDASLEPR